MNRLSLLVVVFAALLAACGNRAEVSPGADGGADGGSEDGGEPPCFDELPGLRAIVFGELDGAPFEEVMNGSTSQTRQGWSYKARFADDPHHSLEMWGTGEVETDVWRDGTGTFEMPLGAPLGGERYCFGEGSRVVYREYGVQLELRTLSRLRPCGEGPESGSVAGCMQHPDGPFGTVRFGVRCAPGESVLAGALAGQSVDGSYGPGGAFTFGEVPETAAGMRIGEDGTAALVRTAAGWRSWIRLEEPSPVAGEYFCTLDGGAIEATYDDIWLTTFGFEMTGLRSRGACPGEPVAGSLEVCIRR